VPRIVLSREIDVCCTVIPGWSERTGPGMTRSGGAISTEAMVDFRFRCGFALERRDGRVLKLRGLLLSGKPRGHFIMMQRRARSVAMLSERLQDFLLISSFGFWAVLLGFFPVLAYHGLMGH
jgi:hypothetical protein